MPESTPSMKAKVIADDLFWKFKDQMSQQDDAEASEAARNCVDIAVDGVIMWMQPDDPEIIEWSAVKYHNRQTI